MSILADNPMAVNRPPADRQTMLIARTSEGDGLVWIKERDGIWRGWPA